MNTGAGVAEITLRETGGAGARSGKGTAVQAVVAGAGASAAGSRRPLLAGAALVLVVGPYLALLLLVEARWGPLLALDDAVRDGLHGWALASPALVLGMAVVSTLGTSGAYAVLLVGLLVVLLRRGERRRAVLAAVAVVGGQLLNAAAKAAVDRPRPLFDDPVAQAASSGFPSGHAQGVVVVTGVLLLVLPRTVRPALLAAAVGWSLLMGASRLVLGVHHLTDVLAGAVLGLAWLAACAAVFGTAPGTSARTAPGGPVLDRDPVPDPVPDPVLDPDAEAYLRVLAAAPAVPQTVEGMRAAYAEAAPGLSGPGEPVAEVRDERLGGVPVRRYRPDGARGTTVWVHGGGWVVGGVETHDALCRALAVRSGSTVVSVDYDLAPEARHPVQVEQVLAVLAALPEGEPVALAGDSAGAHLAALAACRAARPVAGLALVYPVVSPRLDTPSAEESATGRGLTTQGMRWYWEQYLGDGASDAGGTADLLEADLHRLPPALVLTAGHDPLRDEGRALADALEAAGREVRRVAYDGQVHGFFRMTAVIGQAREAQQRVADFLAETLAGAPGPA